MNYAVSQKNGESVRIGVREISESEYELNIDGQIVRVDTARLGSSVYSIIEDGRHFEGAVGARGESGFEVLVGGRIHRFDVVDERTQQLAAAATTTTLSGPQTVHAEMPGKVVKLYVPVGNPVSEGEGVVIIEAMKMENEIAAPVDGVLTSMNISEGDVVEPGSVLFVIEAKDSAG